MRTLELKDICGYIPHGLYFLNGDGMYEEILEHNISDVMRAIRIQDDFDEDEREQIPIPFLRPLSDLYKPIIHDGKEIIPIMELGKMVNDEVNWRMGNCGSDGKYLYGDNVDFSYNKEKGQFTYRREAKRWDHDHMQYLPVSQYQLFDYMNKLKIDFRGLIDAGLAIDCNTLEINPYK